jgi:competence protein ComEC
VAVVSAGVRNRFGHPHPRTLAALAECGIEVLRTDRGGAVVWETDGDAVRVTRP